VRRISRIMRNSEADTVFSSNSGSGLKLSQTAGESYGVIHQDGHGIPNHQLA